MATEEVEKALVQMRSARPETTRGTLNVTLAAHKVFLAERVGDEPLWKTVDRIVGELLRLRAEKPALAHSIGRRGTKIQVNQLPLLWGLGASYTRSPDPQATQSMAQRLR